MSERICNTSKEENLFLTTSLKHLHFIERIINQKVSNLVHLHLTRQHCWFASSWGIATKCYTKGTPYFINKKARSVCYTSLKGNCKERLMTIMKPKKLEITVKLIYIFLCSYPCIAEINSPQLELIGNSMWINQRKTRC